MDTSNSGEYSPPVFFVGQHESRRSYPFTDEILHHAQDHNYDFITAPITNDSFHSRVLSVLSDHKRAIEQDSKSRGGARPSASPSPAAPILPSLIHSDTDLSPTDTISQLIVLTSPWIDLASADPVIAEISRQVLFLEVGYAAFCGASNVLIQGPQSRTGITNANGLSQYARAVQEALRCGPFMQIHLLMPMVEELNSEASHDVGDLALFAVDPIGDEAEHQEAKGELFGSWDAWNLVRTTCKYNSKLSVALAIPRHVPPSPVQSRWFSEPLRILSFPKGTFHQNSSGRPSFTKAQQQMLTLFMRLSFPPWILLSDVGPLPDFHSDPVQSTDHGGGKERRPMPNGTAPTPAEASKTNRDRKSQTDHLDYIRHLQKRQPMKPAIERFGAGYQDYLQSPLQPLTDNLESITYETFEKDPIKYDWYERAIEAALRDWSKLGKPPSAPNGRVTVAVVGAGRGPLVTRAIRASENAGVEIDIWAIEKNFNAYVLLQRHNVREWNRKVNLVRSDMRSWRGPAYLIPNSASDESARSVNDASFASESGTVQSAHIDILISELLGSFADNELSPECLDGIQHLLNPAHGVSIPSTYSAHFSPVASPKIHADICARLSHGDADAAAIPYVVMLHQIDFLSRVGPSPAASHDDEKVLSSSGPMPLSSQEPLIQEAWSFSHPLPQHFLRESNAHNKRFARREFFCRHRGVCHGLAGYFEAVLYEPPAPASGDSGESGGREENGSPGGLMDLEDDSREFSSPVCLMNFDHDWPAPPGKSVAAAPPAEAGGGASAGSSGSAVELSTHPLTMQEKSADMISWFPIYFPLKTPLTFPDNTVLAISMWRQTDGRKVWYEWLVESFAVVRTGAAEGAPRTKRVRAGASDLHSSERNACLM